MRLHRYLTTHLKLERHDRQVVAARQPDLRLWGAKPHALSDKIRATKNNAEFFDSMLRG